MADKFQGFADRPNYPGRNFYLVVPADGADLPDIPKKVVCSAAGNLIIVGENGVQVTLAVNANVEYCISPKRIRATGHTAGNVIAYH